MASEIRVNTINNRSGLGTITISDTGAVFAGVTTITSLQVTGTLIGVANTDNIRTNTNATFLQNVNVSGAVTSTGMIVTGVTTVAAGSTSVPSISPSGDTNTGIFFPSADTIAFGEGGTEAARIDSSGRFGIGTNSPGSGNLLHIADTSKAATARTGVKLQTTDSLAADTGLPVVWSGNIGTQSDYTWASITGRKENATSGQAGGYLQFATGSSAGAVEERVRITSTGAVGIGTTSPTDTNGFGNCIDIRSSTGAAIYLRDSDDTTNDTFVIGRDNSDSYLISNSGNILFSNNGSERARIDSSGRLLVGTSSARSVAGQSHLVQFESANSSPFSGVSIVNNANDGNGSYLILGKSRGTSAGSNTVVQNGDQIGGVFFAAADGSNINGTAASITCNIDAAPGTNDVPGRLMFSTTADGSSSPTERCRITNGGYFKASTTGGYQSSTGGFHEFRQGAAENEILVITHTASSSPYGINMYFAGVSPNNATSYFLYCQDSTAQRATIRSNGGLANYQANNVNLSDINTKKDITPAAGTWDCIKEWEIVNYRYKDQPDDADLNLGVIAQQVAESCPEVITIFQEAKDAKPAVLDDKGNEVEPAQEAQLEKLGIKEQQMYWMAIKALQEAQERIETLETEKTTQQALINDLITRVAALEAQ